MTNSNLRSVMSKNHSTTIYRNQVKTMRFEDSFSFYHTKEILEKISRCWYFVNNNQHRENCFLGNKTELSCRVAQQLEDI